jgi:tetratricopeptide (TPR) repeat protein
MKIIRWLLSHTILILLIVAVIYGYMFWGNLLGENTPAGKAIAYLSDEFEEVAEFVDAVKAKNSKSDQTQSSQQASSETSPAVTENSENVEQIETHVKAAEVMADSHVSNKSAELAKEKAVENIAAVVSANTTSSGIEQKPVSISYSHNDMRITQNSNGITNKALGETVAKPVAQHSHIEGKQEHVASVAASVPNSSAQIASSSNTTNNAVDNGESAENFVSEDVEDKLENLDNHGKVIDASKNETLKESWIIARKSFYQRNYKLSEQSYLKVIDASDDNYDAYGELGNVYFNQGKNQQAASAYYEAAAILVRQGQIRRARSLVGLLHHLDKAKAVELQKLIGSAVVKKVS